MEIDIKMMTEEAYRTLKKRQFLAKRLSWLRTL